MSQSQMVESPALTSTGVVVSVEPLKGVTLAAGTYYFPIGDGDAPWISAHIKWDAVSAGSVVFQDCNLPRYKSAVGTQNTGVVDVSDFDAGAGNWITENSTTAYIPVVGGTVTNMTVTITGGTAGGAIFNLAGLGTKRGRLMVVLSTGGTIRVCYHQKST